MDRYSDTPFLAFVWQPIHIKSSVVETARQTGTRIIFDLSHADWNASGISLLQADADPDHVHLKLPQTALSDPHLEEFLRDTGLRTAWIELHPHVAPQELIGHLDRIAAFPAEFQIVPIVGDVRLCKEILFKYPEIRSIALKGSEAAGFVSTETIFSLYSFVRKLSPALSDPPSFSVWGGIATPEAAAAFLAAGCNGIVCESVHWLTDLAAADNAVSQKIANLRPDHTDIAGMSLGIPCRFFNKGNSKAVKKLKDFTGSLCGSEIGDEQRRFFTEQVLSQWVSPLDSTFSRDELIPLGVEASFAQSFVQRFGSGTEESITNFLEAVDTCLSRAPECAGAFAASRIAMEMGTAYPFIQGAMSWITDNPEFGRRIADAGGLPTIALGMMDEKVLEEKLGGMAAFMKDRPYAVNIIALAENPHRDVQLAWIRKIKPRFAVIAAGEPSHALDLMKDGIEPIYIAPNEELLKMAFDTGIRYVICEGHEAGGHVGQHSTVTLAQMIADLKYRNPDLFKDRRIILAGGICTRETAFMASMLGADAVQMGTVYLATDEIVNTGALSEIYRRMILSAEPGETVVTGEGTGLRVRSLKTPKMDAICSLERDFAAGSEDEASFRHKIEALSAGSLFIAARAMDRPGGTVLDDTSCVAQGQFMSGACSGVIERVMSIAELHRELALAPLAEGLPVTGPLLSQSPARPEPVEIVEPRRQSIPAAIQVSGGDRQVERIAITGMSIVNSLGNSPEEVWAASLGMRSGISPVPNTRWNHELFFHPRPRMPEKTYCRFGAFQNIEVTRKDIGVPPQDFRTMTDATKISMWLARNAVEESGILDSDIPRERIAVLISQNSGEAAATLQDVIIRGALTQILSAVKSVLPMDSAMEEAVSEAVKSGRIAIDDTTLLGRLNCSAGGFICNKYGFMGPSFSVSAACATALVALYSAVQMVRNGIIDAAVVGGGEEFLTPMHFLEFSALGALAGLSGVDRLPGEASRPFDADRDGMVLGEGGGMIVIERESVAKKRGANIHAYITSMGASNNNLGMVESSRTTQEIAIRSSFRDTGYGPDTVDLIECHATSTRQGDVEEVQALKSFYNGDSRTVLTSFKSQIGHTLGASGINSLIRGVMAMKAGILPATLNCHTIDPETDIQGTGIDILSEPAEWNTHNGRPRRFQVNAFGFGGSNYVVQLEQSLSSRDTVVVAPAMEKSMETSTDLLPRGVSFYETKIGDKNYRVSVVAESDQKARSLIASTEPLTDPGPVAAKRIKVLARQGIHLGPADVPPVPLAFVFPGQGSHYAGMGHELYQTFPIIREWMDRAADVADFDILSLIFHDREEDLQKTRWQQPALFTMEYAMVQYLTSLGIRPTALAGHSLGELTALCLAGVYSFEDGFRIVNKRAICMDKACTMNVDPGVMMAVDAPQEVVEEVLSGANGVYITNLNSNHQIVIGGNTEKIKEIGVELKANGFRNTLLRVSMAFHSPIMKCIHDELDEFIADIPFCPPQIPVISNTTTEPFPPDSAEMKRIVMAHLESPVHWMNNVRTLWNDYGVRLFVEVGPRDILSNLIADTIEQAECLQTCLPSVEAVMYKTALAQLFARGHLPVGGRLQSVEFPKAGKIAEKAPVASTQTQMARVQQSVNPPAVRSYATASHPMEEIVHREIGSFVLESFGRFLRPGILSSIRAEVDPNFDEAALDALVSRMFPRSEIPVQTARQQEPIVVSVQESPAQEELPEAETPEMHRLDTTEMVIRIIMEATGYDRDEIEPDMDLREDLSIRSSRLPVIMDSVESHFGIKIELEDFMDVRTIRDISDRIARVMSRQKEKTAGKNEQDAPPQAAPTVTEPAPVEEKQPIKRLTFKHVPLDMGSFQPVELSPLDCVSVFSPTAGTGIRKQLGDIFRRDYGVNIVPVAFLDNSSEGEGFDFRSTSEADSAVQHLSEFESLAGLAFVIDEAFDERVTELQDLSTILTGFFSALKVLLSSPAKKFAILVNKSEDPNGLGNLLAEGVLALFLSAAQEYSSVQFRSVKLDSDVDVSTAIRGALDRSQKVIETIHKEGQVFSLEASPENTVLQDEQRFDLTSDDVIVFSGGASGITPFIALSLVPFGCKMIMLGRTALTSQDESHPSGNGKAAEIHETMQKLRTSGIEATYMSCDVADPVQVEYALREIVSRYGRIDGIVHSAGILRDNFIAQMSPDDFKSVVAVKYEGALNLFNASRDLGLKFFACLSSAASIQGNPGQSNYAAANRMMAALMTHLAELNNSVLFKAFVLPPIEGAGMAENPDIRLFMKRMNAQYVHAEELASLVARELFIASPQDTWVLFMRSLPDVCTVRLISSGPEAGESIAAGTVEFTKSMFPMVDTVNRLDLGRKELIAERAFSQERDLWVSDHKPFKFMKYPLVSAIMAIETFMEASTIVYPHLKVKGVRNAEFLNIIECPPGRERTAEICCRSAYERSGEAACDVSLATREISPTGRIVNRVHDNYRATVILGNATMNLRELEDFAPIDSAVLDTRPMDHEEAINWYIDRTDMQDRYRVMEALEGTYEGAVKGRMVYRISPDFAGIPESRYHYSPYLLEALMQLVNFYIIMRQPSEKRSMIPVRIGEMGFFRNCSDGEIITLEGRMKSRNDEGIGWDTRAIDEDGKLVMYTRNLMMRWFSK